MPTKWRLCGLLACSLVTPVAAATLHKCIGRDGASSYQSAPCETGQRTAWARDIEADPVRAIPAPPPAAAREPAPRRTVAARSASPRRDPAAERCESARREAEHVRDRLWNRLGFRERSELDAKVARACRTR